jgi:uncharacterized cupin superfamily protein/nucleoside-diphosphate-sugar epimerase
VHGGDGRAEEELQSEAHPALVVRGVVDGGAEERHEDREDPGEARHRATITGLQSAVMASPLIILGCGYIGSRVARAALARGRQVRVAARNAARLEPLRQLGAEVKTFDATKLKQMGPTIHGLHGATVLYAIPPITEHSAGEVLARACEAALNGGARSFVYLSSAGLYGDTPDDDWVDEDSGTAHDDMAMTPYHTDESAVQSASFAGLRTCTLRLAAVYGPGRGVRARLARGDYKLLDGGKHWISRVHVDDVVRAIFAAEERAPQGALYLLGDDRPTTQLEYAEWLCKRLGLPLPSSVASYAPGMRRQPHRGRRIKNDKLKRELDFSFQYPTYVEGEAAIEAEERGETPAAPAPAAAAAPAPVAPGPRPACVVAAASVAPESSSYPGMTERFGEWIELSDPIGLTQIGISIHVLRPGERASLPHAHSVEEEFCYVLEGAPDLYLDGTLHRLAPGDAVGFPPGTGVIHTVINNTASPVRLFVGGHRKAPGDRLFYPLNPERQAALKPERAWNDAPRREMGPHDGKPGKA